MNYKLNEDGDIVETDEDLKSGTWKFIEGKLVHVSDRAYAPSHYAGSDDLGTKGVFNPADGKMYDSRSAYYNAVKAKGLVIAGDDAPTQRATPKTESINWEKAVAETLKSPLKGKKK